MSRIFHSISINKIIKLLIKKKISTLELIQECINISNEIGKEHYVWEVFDKDVAFKQAKLSQKKIDSGKEIGLLEGIPVGVKDIFNSIDFPTQMGSPIWRGFTPGNDARCLTYLKKNGSVIPGKTITAEFAVHALNKTLNPHNKRNTPGTSSSGSAVRMLSAFPVSVGTQTAGSIVRPSSFCGIYGCKPSFGLIPRTGILKTTDTLDTIGFLCSSRRPKKSIRFNTSQRTKLSLCS